MSMSKRKKKLAGISMTERLIVDREAKLDLAEEHINQPLNEDIEGNIDLIWLFLELNLK